MEHDACILAIDIGTSGVKACICNRRGEILAKETSGYDLEMNGNRIEQSPDLWWSAVVTSVTQLTQTDLAAAVQAVILTGQMQSVILLEKDQILAPAILYADNRAGQEMIEIFQVIGEDRLCELTGNLNDGSSVLAKLLWLKKNAPQLYQRADHLLLAAHDYLHWRLCGSYVTDHTNAATTGLLDILDNRWAEDMLDQLQLRSDWLPQLMPGWSQSGEISEAAARELGLKAGLPVYHGAGDAASATIGSGAGEAGYFYIYLGTSGWLATTGFDQIVDPQTGIWNLRHIDPERMIYLGPMLSAAGNWEWVRDTFGELERAVAEKDKSPYEVLEGQAASSSPGSNGVFYLPMIHGERAPVRDPHARGVFFGIQKRTTRADLYRAVLEGVAYAMRSIREVMEEKLPAGIQVRELCLTGGGARSALWAQIFADVMDCPVKVLASPEDVGVKGMAVVAGKQLGWHDSYVPDGSFFEFDAVYWPSANVDGYRRRYALYRQIYPSLKQLFSSSAQILEEV